MPTTPRTLSTALATALAEHADHTFGLMGNGNAHLIQGLAEAGVPYTAVRHEAGTVAAADAYARVSGRLAIATTTYGPGFTNALTPLAEAVQARTPMLVVVGDAPSSGPRPCDVDQEMLGAAIGVRTHVVSPGSIEKTVRKAAKKALKGRRPVVIAIPYDLATAHVPAADTEIDPNDPAVVAALVAAVSGAPVKAAERGPEIPSDAALEAAAEALAAAERPLILAGRGAHLADAGAELGGIADALGALTATTALARGIFPESQYDLGITGGFGQQTAMETIAQADAVLVVGASLNQFTMRFGDLFGEHTTVIRIDAEHAAEPQSNRPIRYLPLHGDARVTLAALRNALGNGTPSGWRERVRGLEAGGALRVRDAGSDAHPDAVCPDGRLDPRAVAARIGELLPEDRHVTTDGGHFLGWANMFWPVASPERMIMVGTAYLTIGLGFPTVAGVAAAAPGTTVVLSTGDGGGLMALADLETAIRTSPSTVIVVWNDGAYGAEVHLYGAMGLAEEPMLIPETDFAGLAHALGARGVRVESIGDLDTLGAWAASGAKGTILLDCRISRSVVADYQREVQRANGLELE